MLDACAMIAYLRGEDGADVVEERLIGPEECTAHAVNLCEVYYDFLRAQDKGWARLAIRVLEKDGVLVREDIDRDFWQEVGKYKAAHRVSLADCFAIALANRNGARVVTTDHHEFGPIKEQGICEVEFIR